MRILHTADWHLGDRLGRINRTDHLRRGVERIAAYLETERVAVLLIAGDLFSERCGADGLREATDHLRRTFGPFLRRGGTILALTGNHDHEGFCQTLAHAFELVAPAPAADGDLVAPGRFHLAVGPTFLRLADRPGSGEEVQFVLMPYPTPMRYLEGATRFPGLEQKNRALQSAYLAKLAAIRADPAFRRDLPSVLAAHIHVHGAELSTPTAFRMSEAESIVIPASDVPVDWDYVALGHIHKPQALSGVPHVRYSGSIERLDLGERHDRKGCVLFEIGPDGLVDPPEVLPLESTPITRVVIAVPKLDLPRLREQHPEPSPALVRYELTYTPGVDDLDSVLDEVNAIFPHWYDRECRSAHEPDASAPDAPPMVRRGLHETVVEYLESKLADQPDRDDVLAMARAFLAEDAP